MKVLILITIALTSFASFSQEDPCDDHQDYKPASCEKSQQTLRAAKVYIENNDFTCVVSVPGQNLKEVETLSSNLFSSFEVNDDCKYKMNSRNLHSDKRPGHGYEVVIEDRNKADSELNYKLIIEKNKRDLHRIVVTSYSLSLGDIIKSGDFLDPHVEEGIIKTLEYKVVCDRVKN